MLILPLTSEPAWSVTTDLGEDKFTIATKYNDRSSSWTFDLIRDVDQVKVLSGVPVLLGQDMLAPYAMGIGGMIASDLGNRETDAGPDDLGDRVIVAYVTQLELFELGLAGVPGLTVAEGAPGTGPGGTDPVPGGTVGGTGIPIVDLQQHSDDSGAEVVTCQVPADLSMNVASTVTFAVAFLASSAGGTATYRAYLGGTPGLADGTFIAQATATGATLTPKTIVGTITNPDGVPMLKITMQSSALGVDATIDDLSGTLA